MASLTLSFYIFGEDRQSVGTDGDLPALLTSVNQLCKEEDLKIKNAMKKTDALGLYTFMALYFLLSDET